MTTLPPGLRVRIGGVDAGRSPVAPYEVLAGTVSVRAIPDDPRHFEPAADGTSAIVAAGETLRVSLDLRPTVLLRSLPEPAGVAVVRSRAGGSLAGRYDTTSAETPIRLAPSLLEGSTVRIGLRGYADSLLAGDRILAAAGPGGAISVALRSLHLPPPPPPPKPSLVGRRWFQWTLIGLGAALSGTAAILRHEGDRTYDEYLKATNPQEIERLYDETTRYDHWSSGTLGAGQGLLTAGVFLFVTGIGR